MRTSTATFACFALVLLSVGQAQAQTVDILAADQIVRDPAITEAQRLLGNVQLGHQDGVLHCDSAWRFDDGVVEVFGEVRMEHPLDRAPGRLHRAEARRRLGGSAWREFSSTMKAPR